ncbi:MAG: hypothetical protein ACREMX_16015 [Gemmatimonadales bacterium]
MSDRQPTVILADEEEMLRRLLARTLNLVVTDMPFSTPWCACSHGGPPRSERRQ